MIKPVKECYLIILIWLGSTVTELLYVVKNSVFAFRFWTVICYCFVRWSSRFAIVRTSIPKQTYLVDQEPGVGGLSQQQQQHLLAFP